MAALSVSAYLRMFGVELVGVERVGELLFRVEVGDYKIELPETRSGAVQTAFERAIREQSGHKNLSISTGTLRSPSQKQFTLEGMKKLFNTTDPDELAQAVDRFQKDNALPAHSSEKEIDYISACQGKHGVVRDVPSELVTSLLYFHKKGVMLDGHFYTEGVTERMVKELAIQVMDKRQKGVIVVQPKVELPKEKGVVAAITADPSDNLKEVIGILKQHWPRRCALIKKQSELEQKVLKGSREKCRSGMPDTMPLGSTFALEEGLRLIIDYLEETGRLDGEPEQMKYLQAIVFMMKRNQQFLVNADYTTIKIN